MRRLFALPVLLWIGTLSLQATPCGTVASPTSCSITVGGTNTFTVSGFSFVTSSALGGGTLFQAGDITIDISTGGGLSLVMTFGKNPGAPTNSVVFFANPGETSSFTFTYNVALSAAVPGTVSLVDPVVNNLVLSSASGGGVGQVQLAMSGAPVCLAFTSATQDVCSLAAGVTTTVNPGNIVTLLGGTAGNASIGQFSNVFNSTFTPAADPVPEPSTFALLGIGLLALRFVRR